MTHMNDPHSDVLDPFGLGALVTPAMILLRAELLALEQMLPGHVAPAERSDATAQEATFEAEMDNLPL
jgi:hypothetical protein